MRSIGISAALAILALALAGCSGEPSSPGDDIPTTDVLLASQLEDYRNGVLGLYPDAALPEVEIVALVASTEQPQRLVTCLSEAGYEADIASDGGITLPAVTSAQEESMFIALYTCQSMYPIDPQYLDPLTEEQIREVYDYYVEQLTPCVEERDIPVEPAPSFETFTETFGTDAQWHPYANVVGLSHQDLDEILTACPQLPPGFEG